ncbi:MAG: rhodanese-like domain-containing protein [bacterium]|nr:rhodanese-like domain-containing protein [bacterium]
MLKQKDFFFVNVHTPFEGEIKNTDAFIPYDKIADNLDKLPKDKNAKIVLYCRSGRMSEVAAKELSSLGYTNVYNLIGGMINWEKNGYKINTK